MTARMNPFAAATAQFTEREMRRLTLPICIINSFNRLGAGFRRGHADHLNLQAA
jgi:hypothetical protein